MPREPITSNPYVRVYRDLRDHKKWIPVIAEGDSWFSFPGIAMRMNVIGHLRRTFNARLAILHMYHHGDHATEIVSGNQRRKLRYALRHGFNFKMLLFSGGGNDLIDAMSDILLQRERGMRWQDCIDQVALQSEIDKVRHAYEDLIAMRDELNPRCHIFAHCYDFPTVNGKAVKIFGKRVSGPWLLPVMNDKGIRSKADQRAIIKNVMSEFYRMLMSLPSTARRPFTVVDTRNTLSPAHWQDEIHPSTRGFGLVARKYGRAIRTHFPKTIDKRLLDKF